MARTVRIVNVFFAALFVVMALVSGAFLAAGRDGFTGTRDRASTLLGWTVLFALLAVLAFVNLRGAEAERRRGLIALNLAAAAPLALGAVAAAGIRFLCGTAALPFALTALLLALVRARESA